MNNVLSAETGRMVRREEWRARYADVRGTSLALAAPLSAEDQQIQSMPDVSPTKWHLAHITWFFETFVLTPWLAGYECHDPRFSFLYNSYYEQIGERIPRGQRGLMSRPTVSEVRDYRAHVDTAMERLIRAADEGQWPQIASLVELGLHHEQQHQELSVMDIKHVLSCNPLQPAYLPAPERVEAVRLPQDAAQFVAFPGGLLEIGHAGAGFSFDNEGPRHRVWLEPYALADRLVTCGEYRAFIADGGYRTSRWWLSEGWAVAQAEGWQAPLYWQDEGGGAWSTFTLHGRLPVDDLEPVVHVSHFEADAFARWAGRRLPTEAEWETACGMGASSSADELQLHPAPATGGTGDGALRQMFGAVWQHTSSPYTAYPGFRPDEGAIGEYNGKFMINQMVLRGSCCATPPGHARRTYRNFFPAAARWMFGGIRLAEDRG